MGTTLKRAKACYDQALVNGAPEGIETALMAGLAVAGAITEEHMAIFEHSPQAFEAVRVVFKALGA